jgi:hypothetical protein
MKLAAHKEQKVTLRSPLSRLEEAVWTVAVYPLTVAVVVAQYYFSIDFPANCLLLGSVAGIMLALCYRVCVLRFGGLRNAPPTYRYSIFAGVALFSAFGWGLSFATWYVLG